VASTFHDAAGFQSVVIRMRAIANYSLGASDVK
jgi:hypothetical protein